MVAVRDLLARMASVRPIRRVREISETVTTPRVRAELDAQSARLAEVEQHLPRLLNKINSSDGAARMLARRLDELRSDLQHGEHRAERQPECDEHGVPEERELRPGCGPRSDADHGPSIEIVEPAALNPSDGRLRLNLGCGCKPVPGYANVDVRRLPGVDVVAPVDELPVEPGTVAEIYCARLLEHFPEQHLRGTLLPYWVGLLRPGGVFRVVVPDLEAMAHAYVRGEIDFELLRAVTYGGQQHEGDTHFNGFTVDHLTAVLTGAGLIDVEVVAQARPEGDCLELELSAIRPQ